MHTHRTICVALPLILAGAAQAQPYFKATGELQPGVGSDIQGVAPDGRTVVGASGAGAVTWTVNDKLKLIAEGVAFDATATGATILGWEQGGAWKYSGGQIHDLTNVLGDGAVGFGISADGNVIVGTDADMAFRWAHGGSKSFLPMPPGFDAKSVAFDVSADGAVAVGYASDGASNCAFRWTKNTPNFSVDLGALTEGGSSAAWGVSGDGSVVVGYAEDSTGYAKAFCWTGGGGMQSLGTIDDLPISAATAASWNGAIVVGYARDFDNKGKPFIYDAASGIRDLRDDLLDKYGLNVNGWSDMRPWSISADGLTIVGTGTSPAGKKEGWVAYLGAKPASNTTIASTGPGGKLGNGANSGGSMSSGGQFVAFRSTASNFIVGDTNGASDIFVKNRVTGALSIASVSSTGALANGASSSPGISADGRYVVFASDAKNLVAGDTNGVRDVFLRDRITGKTTRLSVSTAGVQATGGASDRPVISPDGRYIVFESAATNLVNGDSNKRSDIFIRDRLSGSTTRVSLASSGAQATGGDSFGASVAVVGQAVYVAFASNATNLVTPDSNGGSTDVFLRDLNNGKTTRVNVSSAGVQASGVSGHPQISGNGRYIAFDSNAGNLTPPNQGPSADVFVHDRINKTTRRVSLGQGLVEGNADCVPVALSANGRYVLFRSSATNLVTGDTNGAADGFVTDVWTMQTQRVSLAVGGKQVTAASTPTGMSADGRLVLFDTPAKGVVPADQNPFADVFVRELGKP